MAEDIWTDDLGDEGDNQNAQGGTGTEGAEKAARRLKRELADARKELKELSEFKAAQEAKERVADVGKVFEAVKLNPAQAKLFLADNPDVAGTPQEMAAKVVEWAKGYGIAPIQTPASDSDDDDEGAAETPEAPAAESTDGAFSFVQPSEGKQPGTTEKKLSGKELAQLVKTDPVAAQKALASGKADVMANESGSPREFSASQDDFSKLWD